MDESKKITEYFTPSRSTKRPRISSPEFVSDIEPTDTMAGDSKVGDLQRDELMAAISTLLDSKLATLATKEDVKGVSEDILELKSKYVELQQDMTRIKEREQLALDKLEDLENRSRRNNLVFRGLKFTPQTDCRKLVKDFCVGMFGSSDSLWVNRAHPLGKDLIIAHVPDDYQVNHIMSSTKKLKGTGYFVNRDFTKTVRVARGKLMAVRRELQRLAGAGGQRMTLTFDHLYIEGQRFTWKHGKLMCGDEDGCAKLKEKLKVDITEFVRNLEGEDNNSRPGTAAVEATTRQGDKRNTAEATPVSAPQSLTTQVG